LLLYPPMVLTKSKIQYPHRVVKAEKMSEKMSHLSREKLDLVNRTKKIIGQLESVLRCPHNIGSFGPQRRLLPEGGDQSRTATHAA
jgi:hypothetical protein